MGTKVILIFIGTDIIMIEIPKLCSGTWTGPGAGANLMKKLTIEKTRVVRKSGIQLTRKLKANTELRNFEQILKLPIPQAAL